MARFGTKFKPYKKGDTMTSATDGLIPQGEKVQLADDTITLTDFSFAKSLAATSLIAEVIEVTGAKDLFNGTDAQNTFFAKLLAILPVALQNSIPAVIKLVGIMATPNNKVAQIVLGDGVLMDYAEQEGKRISVTATTSQVIHLVRTGISLMGLEPILGNAMTLLRNAAPQESAPESE